jgi:hypothetical protein
VRCAVLKQLGTGGDQRLGKLVADMEAWTALERAEMAAGVSAGLASATYDGVKRALDDIEHLIGGAVKAIASGMSTTLDPQVWVDISRVTNAEPQSEASRRAIDELGRFVGAEHKDFMEAIVMAAMVSAALRAVGRWATNDPQAGYTVLTWLAKHIGALVGEIAADVARANIPYNVGVVLGELCGTMLVETARFYFGV